jgi:hypothetical protein
MIEMLLQFKSVPTMQAACRREILHSQDSFLALRLRFSDHPPKFFAAFLCRHCISRLFAWEYLDAA